MSQHPSDVSMSQQSGPPKKSWFGRNWWWVLLLVIGLPLLCCGGFVGLGFWGVNKGMEMIEQLPPYADTIQLVETDPRSSSALGTPIEVAGIFEGASQGYQIDFSDQYFDGSLPVSGPSGSGVLVIEANLGPAGTWEYDTRELRMDDGTVIDFLVAPGGSDIDTITE